jgi:hypothetical protein
MIRVAAALVAALAVLAPGAACKKKRSPSPGPASSTDGEADPVQRHDPAAGPETAVVAEVMIRRVDPERAIELDDTALATSLGQQLVAESAFAGREEDVPAGRAALPARVVATVSYDLVEAGARGPAIVCAVEAAIEWRQGSRLAAAENVLIERPLAAGERARYAELVLETLERALAQAGAGLIAKESMRQGGEAEVVTGLQAPDPDLVVWALELVAERSLTAGFDKTVELLDARDPAVSAAALRALVALGDPRAVEPLARRAECGDHDSLRVVIEALGAIGGEDAAEFLELLATGHPDGDIRQRATEALERAARPRQVPAR